jgi:hypothetical protein
MSIFTLVGGRASKIGILCRILISSLDLSVKMSRYATAKNDCQGIQSEASMRVTASRQATTIDMM